MKYLYAFLFITLATGQLFRWEVIPSVTVVPSDLIIFIIFLNQVKKSIYKDQILKYLLIFGLVGMTSLLINPLKLNLLQLFSSGLYLARFFLYSSLYFTNLNVFSMMLYWGGAIAALGFIQLFLYPDIRNLFYLGWDPHYGRLVSVFLDPNFTGIILSLHLMLIIKLYIEKNFIINKNILFIFGILSFLALIFTYSRSSWISFIVGLSYVLYKIKKIKLIVPVIIILSVCVFIIPKPRGEGGNLQRTASGFARLENYKKSLSLIQKQPIFGYGFNTLRFLRVPKEIPNHAASGVDNSLLFVVLTTGLVGLIIYLLLGGIIFKSGTELLQGSLVAVTVHSFFQNTLFFPAVLIWIWFLIRSKNI